MKPRLRRVLLWALSLGLCSGFVAAGLWQTGRAVQKEAQLAAAARVLDARSPLPLDRASESMPAWVALRGVFEAVPALRLDNRQRGGRVGVQVYRRFRTESGLRLWVDVGWRPLPAGREVPPEPALPQTSQSIEGLLVPPPAAGLALGPAASALPDGGRLALRLDAVVLREGGPSMDSAVLRLDPAAPIGYERDLDLLANTLPPEKHRGYALQWFGFAAGLFLLSLYLQFRRRP